MVRLTIAGLLLAVTVPCLALNPGSDVLVPAAALEGTWVTDLYVLNPGSTAVSVTVSWLERNQTNPTPAVSTNFDLQPGATKVMENLIADPLGLPDGSTGAFRVTADGLVVVNSRIFSLSDGTTFGQGFEGIPAPQATAAGESTAVVGLTRNASFRTNFFALAAANGATMTVSLRDPDNQELAARQYTLGVYEPMLGPISSIYDGDFASATLLVQVSSGSVIVGASKVDERSGDPTTLESWLVGGGELAAAGTYYGVTGGADGALGGLIIEVDQSAALESLRFTFTSPECGIAVEARGVFAEPVPLTDLAGGISFSNSYDPYGVFDWTVSLSERVSGLNFTGTIEAVGSGWSSDLIECNGPQSGASINLGKQQP